ncbi:recombinase family protein [Raoultella ornithinolytica]|uniref:recombinase family protein n=1 Tax=Raoultella ornithinolytica TaxID=54291 RepID=UPI001BDB2B68|nr:recombinase family protein [Raoultella ornithinolytica]
MSRTFLYCRVSTTQQSVANQLLALKQYGYSVPPSRVITEIISGGVCAMKRPEFQNLYRNKLESGDTLVVLKLDRLGRDMIDVLSTVDLLRSKGIIVKSLDLDGVDLTSASGRFHMSVLAAVANFEKDRIRERTQEGLAKAKADGKKLGRPNAVAPEQIKLCKKNGLSQSMTANELNVSIATVKRYWNHVE